MADLIDGAAWQESWDRQQETYLADREVRFGVLLDAVHAVAGGSPAAVLDLAGGTGSISLRVLRRFPGARTTLVDLDPVLLAIAGASLDERCTIVAADLRTPGWLEALPHREFDAVLTATALHWLDGPRLAELYAEVRTILRPGGLFVNVDHMPDDGLPGLSDRIRGRERAHRRSRLATGALTSWAEWWERAGRDPALGQLVAERALRFGETVSHEFAGPVSWHVDALRAAGYGEVGLIWRGGLDAAVTAVR